MSDLDYFTAGLTRPSYHRIQATVLDITARPTQPGQPAPELRRSASGHLYVHEQSLVETRHIVKRKAGVSGTSRRDTSQPSSTSRSQPTQPAGKERNIASEVTPLKSILRVAAQPSHMSETDVVYATVLGLHGKPVRLEKSPPVPRRTGCGRLFESDRDFGRRPEVQGGRSCLVDGPSMKGDVWCEGTLPEKIGDLETREDSVLGEMARGGKCRFVSDDIWMQIADG